MKEKPFRIIWAVDPFAKPSRFQRSAARVIEAFSARTPTEVLPVHVLAAGLPEKLRAFSDESLKKIVRRGQSNLNGIVGKKKWAMRPLHVLPEKFSSIRGGILALLKFTAKAKGDLIVLSTHARSGPKRWILGSFAETMSNLSPIPLLVAPPRWNPKSGDRTVLFATDFSSESLAAFDRLLVMAAKQDWRIAIFNHVDYQFYPHYAFAFAALDTYEDDVAEVIAARRKIAQKLVAKAKRAGVEAEVVIRSVKTLNVADTIARELKKGYLFAAIASQSGVLANAFIGGTTRQLLRISPVPVWVIHPELTAKIAKAFDGPFTFYPTPERPANFLI